MKLKEFRNQKSIIKCFKMWLKNQRPDSQSYKHLDAFKKLDKNNDGHLSPDELSPYLNDKEEIKSIVNGADANGDDKISWTEFLTGSDSGSHTYTEADLLEAFNYFDKNSDGQIVLDEMKAILKDKATEEEWSEITGNSKTGINFEHFKKLIRT